jgi:hypothetical protein
VHSPKYSLQPWILDLVYGSTTPVELQSQNVRNIDPTQLNIAIQDCFNRLPTALPISVLFNTSIAQRNERRRVRTWSQPTTQHSALSLHPYHPPSSTTLMTDPITLIGLVAGVLQLVDTATTVYDYGSDVKNAPREQQKLSGEYASLKPLLEELQKRERQVDQSNPNDPRVTGMRRLEESLVDCEKKMKKLAVTFESSGLKKVWKRLTWTHHKAEIKDTIVTIGRFKAILNDWLQIDLW